MSDTPRTDEVEMLCDNMRGIMVVNVLYARQFERELAQTNKAMVRLLQERDEWMLKAAKAIRQHDDALKDVESNKAGWDNASLTALDLEQRLKRAEKCISAIEAHYKAKHGESYDHTTLHTIIENWRNK